MFFNKIISKFKKDRISAKKRKREKDYIKATLTLKRRKEFKGVRSEMKGMYLEDIYFTSYNYNFNLI